jgi:hypothetical protein
MNPHDFLALAIALFTQCSIRMAAYCLRVFRIFGRFPQQVLVHVGDAPVTMKTELRGPALSYSHRLVDIRDVDGERLLASPRVGDNIVAILPRLPDIRGSVHRILERIAGLSPEQREGALRRLMLLAGLRNLGKVIEDQAKQMPILNDILDHEVLGREYKRGELTGELKLLRLQIEARFGAIPAWAEERLSGMSAAEIEALSVRLLGANSLEELLR